MRVGITEANNLTLGGEEHNVLSLYGFLHGVSQLNLTRIADIAARGVLWPETAG